MCGGMLSMWPGRPFCMGLCSAKLGKLKSLGETALTPREISRALKGYCSQNFINRFFNIY